MREADEKFEEPTVLVAMNATCVFGSEYIACSGSWSNWTSRHILSKAWNRSQSARVLRVGALVAHPLRFHGRVYALDGRPRPAGSGGHETVSVLVHEARNRERLQAARRFHACEVRLREEVIFKAVHHRGPEAGLENVFEVLVPGLAALAVHATCVELDLLVGPAHVVNGVAPLDFAEVGDLGAGPFLGFRRSVVFPRRFLIEHAVHPDLLAALEDLCLAATFGVPKEAGQDVRALRSQVGQVLRTTSDGYVGDVHEIVKDLEGHRGALSGMSATPPQRAAPRLLSVLR